MIVALPYAHEAHVVPPGRRAHVARWVTDRVEVEVPELSSADCPVALTWRGGPRDDLRRVRTHEGRLRGPFVNPMGVMPAGAFRRVMLGCLNRRQMPLELAALFPHLAATKARVDLRVRPGVEPPPAPGRVVWDDADVRRGEAARTYAESLVAIDGEVWWHHADVEPTWRATRLGPWCAVTLDVGPVRWNQDVFAADRIDDVRRHLRTEHPHRPEATMLRGGSADVEDTCALTDDVIHQARAMLDAVYWHDASDSADGPQPGLARDRAPWKPDARWQGTWIRQAADALVAAAGVGVADVPEALVAITAVTDFLDHVPLKRRRELTQTNRFVDRVRPAVRRWREVELPRRDLAARADEDLRGLAL